MSNMKVRTGFVSNSSSSSFIVIGHSGKYDKFYEYSTEFDTYDQILITDDYCFGWDFTTYRGAATRLAFAIMQAQYVENEKWMQMINDVVLRVTGKKIDCKINVETSYNSYIDHQSASGDGENIEMFESEEKLEAFIFDQDSCIEGGNDNV